MTENKKQRKGVYSFDEEDDIEIIEQWLKETDEQNRDYDGFELSEGADYVEKLKKLITITEDYITQSDEIDVFDVIKYIEDNHWVSLTEEEETREREACEEAGENVSKVDNMFNVWIPYHGWKAIKDRFILGRIEIRK